MDFRFTEEQTMMAQVVSDALGQSCNSAALRATLARGGAHDDERWQMLCDLGLPALWVAEAAGGLGLGAVEAMLVAQACGRACLPEPMGDVVGVSLPLLSQFSDHPAVAPHWDKLLAGTLTVPVKPALNPFVACCDQAPFMVYDQDNSLYWLPMEGVTLVRQDSLDPFRRLFSVGFDKAKALRLGAAAPVMAKITDHATLMHAAQLHGLGRGALDLAVAYAKERQQFGKPIGSYQAIKHHLASADVALRFAEPVLYAAAAELEHHDTAAKARVSQAKLMAADAAHAACRAAIQVHGAMGYSWEVDVHFYLKRVLALTHEWGDTAFHLDRVAARAFTLPLGPDTLFEREAAHG